MSIGQLSMGITWVPGDRPEVGQVCVSVHHIKFEAQRLDQPVNKVNPWITVVAYDDQARPKQIPRWDPRTGLRKGLSAMTGGIKFGGAFKGHMEWPETMRKDPTGHYLMSRDHTEKGHGWDAQEALWKWAHKWGEQFSIEDFAIRKESAAVSARSNSISLKACRLITVAILRRSLAYVSNRQAMLISDATFNRAGAVPGIIDAIIVQGERIPEQFRNVKQLIEAYTQTGKAFSNVKAQLVQEYERQVNQNLGELDMWSAAMQETAVNLDKYEIQDPFPQMQKVLWIRYCRAGDGERQNVQIPVDNDGNLRPLRLKLDMENIPGKVSKAQAQMSITKEEFVSCVLEQPLLSEALRQLNTGERNVGNLPPWNPIKLDVTLTDPNRRYEDDMMFDISNVRQGILLEVWDHDLGRDDFLGECWVPPLGTMHAQPRRYVLPIRNMQVGTKNSTREDKRKKLADNVVCTGDLHIEASWTIPSEPLPEQTPDEPIELRIKREEITHTGKLVLKILKAEGLMSGDGSSSGRMGLSRKGKTADPYVCGYQLNEASGEWKHSHVTKTTETILKTHVKKSTLHPEWNEEFKFQIKTGAFEQKTKVTASHQKFRLSMTAGQKKDLQAEQMINMMEQDEVRVFFGDEEREKKEGGRGERGARHKVKVYLGDTVRQFKNKLMLACQKEADLETDPSIKSQYKSVSLTFNHAVTVFVPSDKLRSLFNQARNQAQEYKRLYKLEEQDPAFWQPLDPIRTFTNYASTYGFGLQIAGPPGQRDPAQRLRIAEATPEYKMRNQRYKHFEEEIRSGTVRIEETDDSKLCFGHGLYVHEADGNTTEWRPVLVERPDQAGDMTKRTFGVKWLYAFGGKDPTELTGHSELDEESVILAPRLPKLLGSGTLEHQQFLEEAPELRGQGLSDHDIAAKLNDKLRLKFQLAKQSDESSGGKSELMMPALISVSEVQHYFKRIEHEGGSLNPTAPSPPAASSQPALPAPSASSSSGAPQGSRFGGGVGSMTGGPPASSGGPMVGSGYPASSGGPMQAGMDNRQYGQSMGAMRG